MLILFSLIINSVSYYCIYCIILLKHLRFSFVLIKRVQTTAGDQEPSVW